LEVLKKKELTIHAEEKSRQVIAEAAITKAFFSQGKTLSLSSFREFMRRLHDTILRLQFEMMLGGDRGTVHIADFASYLVSYGTHKQLTDAQIRIEKLRQDNTVVTLEEFLQFHDMLDQLPEIENTLAMFFTSGEPFTPQQMLRVVTAVTGIDLNPKHLQMLFYLFDVNGDGKLEHRELIGFLKRKKAHGLGRPRDLGLTRFLKCVNKCYYHD